MHSDGTVVHVHYRSQFAEDEAPGGGTKSLSASRKRSAADLGSGAIGGWKVETVASGRQEKAISHRYWNEDPMNGCLTGMKFPILHVK
jgi:hypothetical protein